MFQNGNMIKKQMASREERGTDGFAMGGAGNTAGGP
jgi:hypothetical protein